MNYGLKPLPRDDRDYPLGAVAVLPDPKTLPENFKLDTLPVRDQTDSDFCTGFTTCEASGQQEGVELCPEWSFAMTKHLEGDHTTYGADLRTACKVHKEYGAIEKTDSPYTLENKDSDFLRNPEVWPVGLIEKAALHKKKSYFKVTGPYDHFDNLRASIYKYKSAAAIGVIWGWPMTDVYIKTPSNTGGGHAIPVVGWEGDYLTIKQSYGLDAGDHGFQYLHRDVINANVDKYGAFMFLDLPKPEVATVTPENEMQSLILRFMEILRRLLAKLNG